MAITIDEMLDLLSFASTELVGGYANHGPMASEALFAMGRDEAVLHWVEGYRGLLVHRPSRLVPISPDDWQDSLGRRDRVGDWIEFYRRELEMTPWQDVVRKWVPRLAPAVMAAATHGLIRTSHAVRSLSAAETSQRKAELAQGLGYWAASYYTIPGSPSGADAGHMPRSALDRVERFHGADFDGAGPINEQIKGMEDHTGFATVIDLVDTSGDISHFISEITETFAGIYMASSKNLIAYVHTVTAPSALRMLIPYLEDTDARQAARYAWQACAAIYSWYATTPAQDKSGLEATSGDQKGEDQEDLIDRAVAAGGAHSIKLTEACLREYGLNPKPVYLAAARDAAERVGPN